MDSIIQKLVGDLVKGAAQAEGFIRGSRMQVDLGGDLVGQKVANHAGLGSLAGGLVLPGLGAPIGAALGADEGQRGQAAIGSILGGLGGSAAGGLGGAGLGALIGALAGKPGIGAALGGGAGGALGGIGGMMYGAQRGGEKESIIDKLSSMKLGFFSMSNPAQVAQQLVHGAGPAIGGPKKGPPPVPAAAKKGPPPIPASAKAAFDNGAKSAAERFGIKEAFLPLLGAIAGPMLARAGVGALARGAGGRMLGGLAGKVAPRIAGGLGGAAFDQAASAAGGALGNKMMPQQPQGMMG